MQGEQKAINEYLKIHQKNSKELEISEEFFNEESPYYKLLSNNYTPLTKELELWKNETFETNQSHKEQLKFKTKSGNMVRSKTELIIDGFLTDYNIPFRYECALKLGNHTVFPDFTIRHPKTGELYYWEHFGMIDVENYMESASQKLKEYVRNGIIPSVNLILTYETLKEQLKTEMIEALIVYYFT